MRRGPSSSASQERFRLTLSRTALRQQDQAGIYCKPTVSLEYQRQSQSYVVRGVESGGATAELGHYVVFCGARGEPLSWLHPVQSAAPNGPHAVIIAPVLVSVEVFRARQTYELLISSHRPTASEPGTRPQLKSQILFRGTQGYLSLELWGRDKDSAGRILPEFFRRSGDRKEVPSLFAGAAKAATRGAAVINCRDAVFAGPPGRSEVSVLEAAASVTGEDPAA